MTLRRRTYDREIMDDFSITDERIVHALDELRTINIALGGNSTSREGLRALMLAPASSGGARHTAPLTVLDVGAGGSDTVRMRHNGARAIRVISADLNTGVCRYMKERDPAHEVVCGDAFALPFAEGSVDIVHVSLFLHHFTEDEIHRLLTSFLGIARTGVVVNDLRRSWFALAGIRMLTLLFSRSAMVRHDAPLSVRRGFVRSDMLVQLGRLRCTSYTLHRRWAFRWLAVIRK